MEEVGEHEAEVAEDLVELSLLLEHVLHELVPPARQDVQDGYAVRKTIMEVKLRSSSLAFNHPFGYLSYWVRCLPKDALFYYKYSPMPMSYFSLIFVTYRIWWLA